MAKARRKSGAGGPLPSQNVGSTSGAGAPNPAPQRGAATGSAQPTKDSSSAVESAEVVTSTPVRTPEAGDEAGSLRDSLAGVRTFREEIRTAHEELRALLKGLRAEIVAAGAAVSELHGRLKREDESLAQSHGEIQEILSESHAEVRQLRAEMGLLRGHTAGAGEPARNDEPVRSHRTPSTDQSENPAVEPEAKKNRFGATVAPGVVIARVVPDSPAATGGLARGDVIEEVNGRVVLTGDELREALQVAPDRDGVTLHLRRGSERLVRTVPFGSGGAVHEPGGHFGLTVVSGVVVAEVFVGSPAAAAGVTQGDVIEDAHGQPVQTGNQLLAVIHKQPAGSDVVLIVSRAGVRHELVARLDRE